MTAENPKWQDGNLKLTNVMNLLKSLAGALMGAGPGIHPPMDPTIYRIETMARKYCGRIVYQDDVVIKLKIAKPKPVKILKSNIERITIVKSAVADQYFQWNNARVKA